MLSDSEVRSRGFTSNRKVQGCSCQLFGDNPKYGSPRNLETFQLFYLFCCLIQSSLMKNHKNSIIYENSLLEKILNAHLMLSET